MILLLAAMLLQDAPVTATPIPVPSVPVEQLPDAPKPHYLRDAASRFAFVMSTRKITKAGRVYGGGTTIELDPHVTVSAGYENTGWAAGVIIRPFPKK